MSFTLATIASGSSGNSNLIIADNTLIVSDCGISGKSFASGLEALALSAPDALLLTHSHSDHVKGAYILAKKYDIPVYATKETAENCHFIPKEYIKEISPGCPFEISGVNIMPFSVSHDTASPVAYTFTKGCAKASVITDTGILTEKMYNHLSGSESIIIESNHDEDMLMNGPYPYFLKKRILGATGHMSNCLCASVVSRLLKDGTKAFMLAHLSEHNNTKELAFRVNNEALSAAGIPYTLKIAEKDTPTVL